MKDTNMWKHAERDTEMRETVTERDKYARVRRDRYRMSQKREREERQSNKQTERTG